MTPPAAAPPPAPAALVAAALLFWGVLSGYWPLGAILAAACAAPRWSARRWTPQARDHDRLAELATLLVVVALGLALARGSWPQSLFDFLAWLPLLLAPLALAEAWAASPGMPVASLYVLRRLLGRRVADARRVAIGLPYVFVCLLAAGAGGIQPALFYGGSCLLAAWALFPLAPAAGAGRAWRWALAWTLVCLLGLGIHSGLYRLQTLLEDAGTAWLAQWLAGANDPLHARTRIGELGRLKLQDRIVMRVIPAQPGDRLLLREASYDRYAGGTWWASQTGFAAVAAGDDGGRTLAPPRQLARQATISYRWPQAEGLLPLPAASRRIDDLPAASMERSRFGAVKLSQASGLLRFRVHYDPHEIPDAPPAAADLAVAPEVAKAVSQVATELGLAVLPVAERVRAIEGFFAKDFRYTLSLADASGASRSLARFLLEDRAGHCEYFAAATVMLLRQAAIPARYVVGYAAQEYNAREGVLRVRERHGHAWAQAWVDDRWVELDTTPASWLVAEDAAADSWWRVVADELSWWRERIDAWRQASDAAPRLGALAIVALLAGFILLRWWRARRRNDIRSVQPVRPSRRAAASPYARLEAALAAAGRGRRPGETPRAWLARLRCEGLAPADVERLRAVVDAHYRATYDPAGGGQRAVMERLAGAAAASVWK